jgi:hypothetical protein
MSMETTEALLAYNAYLGSWYAWVSSDRFPVQDEDYFWIRMDGFYLKATFHADHQGLIISDLFCKLNRHRTYPIKIDDTIMVPF